ncbi:endonuclease/exonuclease/phosphatase family protein [Pseudoruegeria sp. HB172150]|uniref:endonuclease/exonuclease/phosphatase family protein n=1 Tax=Pseudoruegeria sp. HB172150 TaxID=2721164 RepID=UPI00155628D1|nr:endonuclease/exonuclease/phosphatase family protein [Pseudoruegeria sp. HB172150]
MPFYNDLRPEADFKERDFERVFPNMTVEARKRCIDGLLRLKPGLQAAVPSRRTEANLLVASWNIKNFGTSQQRLDEAYFYIAEILATFDLIAIQEVKSKLLQLDQVMRLLGPDWSYLVNDVTEGVAGNDERSAYVYNRNRVQLSGLAGEIALWKELREAVPGEADVELEQLARAPFMTGFVTAWKRFAMINLHLEPSDTRDAVRLRSEEVRLLLAALEKKRRGLWSDNLVLVGDMNFYRSKDQANVTALETAGYVENGGLVGKPTNARPADAVDGPVETYDRMFFRANDYFRFALSGGAESGGVFDPFGFVYRAEDVATYRAEMLEDYGGDKDLAGDEGELRTYYLDTWRENQLSDHYPIWVELEIDDSLDFLREKRGQL